MAAIDLIVLGMIKQQPQSAYELQKNVEYRNISRWVKISTPSIYKKVIQLEEKGYLEAELVREGNMPEKSVYRITPEGEHFFYGPDGKNSAGNREYFPEFQCGDHEPGFYAGGKEKGASGRNT